MASVGVEKGRYLNTRNKLFTCFLFLNSSIMNLCRLILSFSSSSSSIQPFSLSLSYSLSKEDKHFISLKNWVGLLWTSILL